MAAPPVQSPGRRRRMFACAGSLASNRLHFLCAPGRLFPFSQPAGRALPSAPVLTQQMGPGRLRRRRVSKQFHRQLQGAVAEGAGSGFLVIPFPPPDPGPVNRAARRRSGLPCRSGDRPHPRRLERGLSFPASSSASAAGLGSRRPHAAGRAWARSAAVCSIRLRIRDVCCRSFAIRPPAGTGAASRGRGHGLEFAQALAGPQFRGAADSRPPGTAGPPADPNQAGAGASWPSPPR